MRVFLAIDLPKEVKDYLFNLQKEVGSNLAKINWVHKKNIHLTLKFFGEISENNLEKIRLKLKKIKFKPFKISMNKLGVFPDEDYIRIVWVNLKPEDKIIKLQQQIDSELLDLFSQDQRFYAHLTLGRVKFVKDKKQFIDKLKSIKVENMQFKVDNFKLIKSELTKDGPKYYLLEEYH